MTIESLQKANDLKDRIYNLETYIKGIQDAIKSGCKLQSAIFTTDTPDDKGYNHIDVFAAYLPEIKLTDVLVKVEHRLLELQAELNAL